jgi:hypothetical protein
VCSPTTIGAAFVLDGVVSGIDHGRPRSRVVWVWPDI